MVFDDVSVDMTETEHARSDVGLKFPASTPIFLGAIAGSVGRDETDVAAARLFVDALERCFVKWRLGRLLQLLPDLLQ